MKLGIKLDERNKQAHPHTRGYLVVYPMDAHPVFPDRPTGPRRFTGLSDDEGILQSFSWSKRLGNAAGTWTATVRWHRGRMSWGDVAPGDWADLALVIDGIVYPLCRGPIGTVQRGRRSVDGAVADDIVLTGKDHGKLFESKIAWANIYIQSISEVGFGLYSQRVRDEIGGGPDGMFQLLLDAAFGQQTSKTQSSWKLPPALSHAKNSGDRFANALSSRLVGDFRGAYYNEAQLWANPGETLWQALQNWTNPALNEVICDLSPDIGEAWQMAVTLQEKPFVARSGRSSPWFRLREWEIPSWLIDTDSLAMSDLERADVMEVVATYHYGAPPGEQHALTPPSWNKSDVERYGICPFLESTKYINKDSKDPGAWATERKAWQDLMTDWYGLNACWLSGTYATRPALPMIRVGDRIRVMREPVEIARVEGVDINYTYGVNGPRSAGSIAVSRGFIGTDQELVDAVARQSARFKTVF